MVEAGRSTFQLATLPKEDFPVMAASDYAANFIAPAPMLRRLFDKSKFAISTEETRYYLNGVYFHVAEGPKTAPRSGPWRPTATGWRGSTRPCPMAPPTCPA
jgi:DNA polymerase III sliding clamp (beta) subunit (PCNA family)